MSSKTKKTCAIIAACYLLAVAPALLVPTPIFPISTIWFPSGIAWAALLIAGRQYWPVITASSFFATFALSLFLGLDPTPSLISGFIIAVSATLEPLIGLSILGRFDQIPSPSLNTKKRVSTYITAIIAGSLAAAVFSVISFSVTGMIAASDVAYAILLWFVGDSLGILLIGTLALTIQLAKEPIWRARRTSIGVLILALTAAILVIFGLSASNQKSTAERWLSDQGKQTLDRVRSDIKQYTSAVHGLAAFFESSQFVDRDEFRRFTTGYLNRLNGLQAMGFAPYTTVNSAKDLSVLAESDGIDGYEIQSYGNELFTKPSDPSYPVLYAEPIAATRPVLGYDLLTQLARREALLASARNKQPIITAPISLLTTTDGPLSILLLHALFSKPNSSDSSALLPPKALPSGVLIAALDVSNMLATAFKVDNKSVYLELIDTAPDHSNRALASSKQPSPAAGLSKITVMPSWEQVFEVAGREWKLSLNTGSGFMAQFRDWQSVAILLGAVFITILLLGFQLLLTGYTARVEKLVDARTKQLSDSNTELAHLAELEKKNADQLAAQANELVRSNEELQQFAYIASHDMQEPLRSMTGFAKLLDRRYSEQLDGPGKEYIGFIVDGAERMRAIIVALLSYSRVGTNTPDFQAVDLRALLEGTLHDLQVSISESNADIQIGDLPTVRGDNGQLSLVMQNLVSNAIKYRMDSRPLAIEITAKPFETAKEKNESWQITVADNGIGISSEHFGRIFEIFKRLHSSVYYPGTGIGLAICQRVVERHGGKIWVESEEDRGSYFHFTLEDANVIVPTKKG